MYFKAPQRRFIMRGKRFCFYFIIVGCILVLLELLLIKRSRMIPVCKQVIHRNNSLKQIVQQQLLEFPDRSFTAVWVSSDKDLMGRLQDMAAKIDIIKQLIKDNYHLLSEEIQSELCIIDGSNINYLQLLSDTGKFIPIILPWVHNDAGPYSSLTDTKNLMLQKYYEWIAEPDLCVKIKDATVGKYYHITYNYTCVSNPANTMKPKSLDLLTLNSRAVSYTFPTYPPNFSSQLPAYVTYMLISVNSVIDTEGNIHTDDVKYVPYTCEYDLNRRPPEGFLNFKIYPEVFTITQYWGTGHFHKNIECFPRIAPFLTFLHKNPQIFLHVPDRGHFTQTLLGYLGLSSDRFITGYIRAKIVYIPSTTDCGTAQITNTQLLSMQYRTVIRKMFATASIRSSIILIRRSGSRKFKHQESIEHVLKTISSEYGLRFEMFIDNPSQSIESAMRMFNRATMVVAPHGAGLFNIIFAEPGTFVIEGVCNRPHTNLCYQRLAYILGHHYHAIPSKQGCEGVIDINASDIDRIVRMYINEIIKLIRT